MKAAVLTNKKEITIHDVPRPRPTGNEVVIKVAYAGICGSDVHAYHNLMFPIGTVLGHEFAGTIEEVGPDVKDLKRGDRIVARPPGLCGCEFCQRGELAYCVNHFDNTLGLKMPGGFAEYVLAKEYQAIKIPDSMKFEEAAQMEPLAVSVHAVNNSGIKVGNTAVIIGGGPIGLSILQLVKAAGAKKIYMVEVSQMRRDKAKELGADILINPIEEDAVKKIMDDNPIGVDIVYECAGKEVTFDTALRVCKKGGRFVLVGANTDPIKINQLRLLQWGITVQASMGYFVDDFKAALQCTEAKMIDLMSLVSHTVALNKIEDGFRFLENPEKALKVLVNPNVEE